MQKNKHVLILIVCLVFSLTGHALAQTVNDSRKTDPVNLKVFHKDTWSTEGYIDLSKDVPEGATINWIKLINYTVSSTAENYGNIYIKMWDATGKSTRLTLNETNTDFAGQPAKQKFCLKFYTNYLQFEGNALYLQQPTVIISYSTSESGKINK